MKTLADLCELRVSAVNIDPWRKKSISRKGAKAQSVEDVKNILTAEALRTRESKGLIDEYSDLCELRVSAVKT
jgi:hypothetical protein